MNRREFIKIASTATTTAILSRPRLTSMQEAAGPQLFEAEAPPFLELQGGPFRNSCDGLAGYNNVSFEEMTQDIIHHRMPEQWREQLVLGITNVRRKA